MGQLVLAAKEALTADASASGDIQRRALVGDALRLLIQNETVLAKAYPMALLEIFAEGPARSGARMVDDTGIDFGELALMDDTQVHDQMELARAQQLAAHATDAVLAELNTLVSSAQGLRNVQPERNPLRPENYIRALQQVVTETGVAQAVRQLWMQHMRELLAQLLVDEYQNAAKSLREHGVEPVGYAVLGMPAAGMGGGGRGVGRSLNGHGDSGQGYSYSPEDGAYSSSAGEGNAPSRLSWEAEEALLTVGILRQMLAQGGDPFAMDPLLDTGGSTQPMVRLERLLERLSVNPAASGSGWARAGALAMEDQVYSPAVATEVVARMMQNIAQDERLQPSVQRAVLNLEPAIRQLVQHDERFFTNDHHPARRLLDELTQRSLDFESESAPGFSQFMRLLDEAVAHLAATEIQNEEPFDRVLQALQVAWELQAKKIKAQQEAENEQALLAQQRQMRVDRLVADIRSQPDLAQVPEDIRSFVLGPWVDVVVKAQQAQPEDMSGDPGGYLALVPLLLWSAQPERTRADPDRLTKAIPGILATVRAGLKTIRHPAGQTSAFLQQLIRLHQTAFEKWDGVAVSPRIEALAVDLEIEIQNLAFSDAAPNPAESAVAGPEALVADMAPAAAPQPPPALDKSQEPGGAQALQADTRHPLAEFAVGVWVELTANHQPIRTQLTWASPSASLFLFTAADGSTQSMTRRMRDKLAAEGHLHVLPEAPQASRKTAKPEPPR